MKEQWLPVVGYEGTYEVSSLGRVRSLPRVIDHPNGATFRKGTLLKASPNTSDRLSVVLCSNAHRKTVQVHALVARAFKGKPKDGQEVLHQNHQYQDNRASNLEWGTRTENLLMDYRDGNRHAKRGPRSTNSEGT